jgi:hypothetical protein
MSVFAVRSHSAVVHPRRQMRPKRDFPYLGRFCFLVFFLLFFFVVSTLHFTIYHAAIVLKFEQ